jgi:hypothetical protein
MRAAVSEVGVLRALVWSVREKTWPWPAGSC